MKTQRVMPEPPFLYGTAWKEERTSRLVRLALEAGFRGIDTANQRRHYNEAGVGEALAGAIADGLVTRDDVFLQTKFTHLAGQDHRLPYDRAASLATQVKQSFASSLEHLRVERIDSLVLHGPSSRFVLNAGDLEVWGAMEEVHAAGGTTYLGASNIDLGQLEELHAQARVKPTFVQNRCFAELGWDRDIRRFCLDHAITYQGFSLLTANRGVLQHPELRRLAEKHGVTPAQIVFRFALDVGMLPLTGTTDATHMREDLACVGLALEPGDLELIEGLAT